MRLLVLACLLVIGCSNPAPERSQPGASVLPALQTEPVILSVVATFQVSDGETFRVRIVKPRDIALARTLLSGAVGNAIPNGRIVRGVTDVNEDFSWSIDPNDFEFADVTTEVCDGLPADVGKATWSSDRYCPWTARIVAIEG